jgi:hypothetical protein
MSQMVHPKFLDMLLDHSSVDSADKKVCANYCMVCALKALVEAYIQSAGNASRLGNSIKQFKATYMNYSAATNHNPLGIDRHQRQGDPWDLFNFLFLHWHEVLTQQVGLSR